MFSSTGKFANEASIKQKKSRASFFCFFFSSFSSSSFDLGPPSSFSFPSYRPSLLSSSLSCLSTSAREKKLPTRLPARGRAQAPLVEQRLLGRMRRRVGIQQLEPLVRS